MSGAVLAGWARGFGSPPRVPGPHCHLLPMVLLLRQALAMGSPLVVHTFAQCREERHAGSPANTAVRQQRCEILSADPVCWPARTAQKPGPHSSLRCLDALRPLDSDDDAASHAQ